MVLVTIINLLLYLIYKLSFIIGIYVWKSVIYTWFGTIYAFWHLPAMLKHILCGKESLYFIAGYSIPKWFLPIYTWSNKLHNFSLFYVSFQTVLLHILFVPKLKSIKFYTIVISLFTSLIINEVKNTFLCAHSTFVLLFWKTDPFLVLFLLCFSFSYWFPGILYIYGTLSACWHEV